MRALDRKLLRDARSHAAQVAAIALVLACGVATFVMSLSTLSSLSRAQAEFYERQRFADVFARVRRAPESVAERIAAIPGVGEVETRVVADAQIDVPGFAEPVMGRVLSLPDGARERLNVVRLRRGRVPDASRRGEVVLGEAFAAAQRLGPGDRLAVTLEGRRRELTVVGIGSSPEFVYSIRAGEIVPDDLRSGVLWMSRAELGAALDLDGAFNDLSVALRPGANAADVIGRIDAATARFGALGAHDRSEQTSHRYVSDEMTQLRGMASVPPLIFLSVAAFLVHVVLGRLIGTQREAIAALKAFGYGDAAVGLHYLGFVAIVVVAGSVLGVAAGAWLGAGLTELYARFFRFPWFEFRLDRLSIVASVGACSAAAAAGALGAVRRVVRLPPAAALRSEAPATAGTSALETLGAAKLLPLLTRMVLRHVEARPVQSALACLGISLSAAVVVLGSFVRDSVDVVVRRQFEQVQRNDVAVTFDRQVGSSALAGLTRIPGVRSCEPVRTVPVRLRLGPRSRLVGIAGLARTASLLRVLGDDGAPVPLAADGVVLSRLLAERLGANRGDEVSVEVLEGARPVRALRVAAVVEEFSGLTAWASVDCVRRMLREQDTVTGAVLAVEAGREDGVHAALKAMPRVSGVAVKAATVRTLRALMSENLLRMRTVNLSFAVILAFGVVFNAARVSLSEHARELASLRVLGFTRREISWVLLGEQAAITLPAVPVGLAAGRMFAWIVTRALETDTQSFPAVVAPSTYGLAASVALCAAALSALVVRRRLDRLDLVAVLKARE